MRKNRNNNIVKRENDIVRRKTNYWYILLGSITVIVSIIVANLININREVRMNGQPVKCPIVDISYSAKGGNSGNVKINGQVLHVIKLDGYLKVGDSIIVRYDKEKALVVQEKFTKGYFVLYFALDGILLLMGLGIIYGGIKGENRIIRIKKNEFENLNVNGVA